MLNDGFVSAETMMGILRFPWILALRRFRVGKEIMCPAFDTLRAALLTALRPTGATRIFDTAGSAPLPLPLDRV